MKRSAGSMPGRSAFGAPAVAVLVLLALAIAVSGSAKLPLDGHEVLVVGTAQEMHDRGNWVVPYFNGNLRLTKPPLSYWLTGVTAWLSGGLDRIQGWHGRVPSIVAGFGMVLLTWFTGRRLFGETTGITAGLLLASSVGFFSYSHDARPDMVYAFWCMGALSSFVFALTASREHRAWAIYAMWAAYGLATLTKGPQLPLSLVVACVLYLGVSGYGWGRGLALLRIFSGLMLVLAIVLPWWWLLLDSVPSDALDVSELSGTLLMPHWRDGLDSYYLYQPLILIIPWLGLLPTTLWRLRRQLPKKGTELLLLLLVLVPALVLSFGPQQRWFYLLPVVPVMCLLLALGVQTFAARCQIHPARWRRWFWPAHMILAGATAVGLLVGKVVSGTTWSVMAALLLVFAALLLWHSGKMTKSQRGRVILQVWSSCVMVGLLGVGLADTQLPWSTDRYNKARLAQATGRQLQPGTDIYAWYINPNIYVHYLHRPVPRIKGLGELKLALQQSHSGRVALILPGSLLSAVWGWPGLGYPEPLGSIPYGDSDTTMVVRIHKVALPAPPL